MMPLSRQPSPVVVYFDDRGDTSAQGRAGLTLQACDAYRPRRTASKGARQCKKVGITRVDADGRKIARCHSVTNLTQTVIVPQQDDNR
jgi:hypothetical protein